MSGKNSATFTGVLNALVPEKFEQDGQSKTRWHEIGAAFVRAPEGGDPYLVIRIPPGISISGEVHIRPRRQKQR